ncbi:hypothetical protein T484DRAFT_1819411 [Baffinella frigidus]|nr:hypothetical protein T484DRAFT_1819411 [Cryptophyta sp. CCMP2293]
MRTRDLSRSGHNLVRRSASEGLASELDLTRDLLRSELTIRAEMERQARPPTSLSARERRPDAAPQSPRKGAPLMVAKPQLASPHRLL